MRYGKASRLALDAMFAAFALMLAFVEAVIPISSIVPIPGFRLGLSNIAVMAALYYSGRADALCVALVKVAVTSILFSNPMSFAFSLSGTLFSVLVLILLSLIPRAPFSFIGLSVISALCHNAGQIAVAFAYFGAPALAFIPYLLIVSLISGILTGILLCSVSPILDRFSIKNNGK